MVSVVEVAVVAAAFEFLFNECARRREKLDMIDDDLDKGYVYRLRVADGFNSTDSRPGTSEVGSGGLRSVYEDCCRHTTHLAFALYASNSSCAPEPGFQAKALKHRQF